MVFISKTKPKDYKQTDKKFIQGKIFVNKENPKVS